MELPGHTVCTGTDNHIKGNLILVFPCSKNNFNTVNWGDFGQLFFIGDVKRLRGESFDSLQLWQHVYDVRLTLDFSASKSLETAAP